MGWLGNIKMGDINKQTMESFTAYLSKDANVGNSTYNAIIRVLKAVFNHAVEDGVMVSNPLGKKLGRMKPVVSNTEALLPADIPKIIDAVSEEDLYWRTLYLFLIATGCRRGEIVALRWDDLDLDSDYPCVYIRHSVEYIPGQPLTVVDAKTLNSRRSIYLPKMVVDPLKEMREQCDIGFVFCGKQGNEELLHPDSINTHTDRMCERRGLKHFTPHTLRRTFATTLAIREKIDPKTLQTLMGHSDLRTLMKYYVITDNDSKKQAVDAYTKYFTDIETS